MKLRKAVFKIDKQILETIKCFFGDLHGVKTDDFYFEYARICKMDGVEMREKSVVIREACDACGIKTKLVYHKVFDERG